MHCGSCVSAGGGVSLPGRRDLTVRVKSPGMFCFEKLMHCGSRVYCGEWQAQRVLCLCVVPRIVREAVMHMHTDQHKYTQIHTPLIYGYTAAQQDPAFVDLEYTERVHSRNACIYVPINTS